MGTGYFMLVLFAIGTGITTVPVPFKSMDECRAQGKSVAQALSTTTNPVRYACLQAAR